MKISYSDGILEAFKYLLSNYPEVFTIGQGLWAPWYVGSSMKDLDKIFGKERVIDSPVSELAVTGAALGASLCGSKAIVVHPRMDFMLLAVDQIVSQAANWSSMFGGEQSPAVTIRGIINRGGEQGAQHSQSLHAWFSHVPGLKVLMPATASDARDLLIAATLSDSPALYIDDRWLYDLEDEVPAAKDISLNDIRPEVRIAGKDVTLVGAGYASQLNIEAAKLLHEENISAEVIDLRMTNPLYYDEICASVKKTGRLVVSDAGYGPCGLAGEIIAAVCERVPTSNFLAMPQRVVLPSSPAPTSSTLEKIYYFTAEDVFKTAVSLFKDERLKQKVNS